jgi:uncharacterized membrane protein YhaH (DUF805 family)
MTQSLDFWSFSGRVGRGRYAVVGFLAFTVKHNLDRLLAQPQKVPWSPWNYWIPFGEMFRGAPSGPKEQELAKTMFLVALPFLWIAITFTVKRLRDAGQPLWLAFLAVVPAVNVLFFVLLCVLPSRPFYGTNLRNEPIRGGEQGFWPQSRAGSAALGVLFAAMLGVVGTWLDLRLLGNYGWTLFIGLPFVMGYAAVWIACHRRSREPKDVIAVVSWTVALAALGVCVIAIEGIICIAMAAPIAWLLAFLGGVVAYAVHNRPEWSRPSAQPFAALLLVLPWLFGAEHMSPPPIPRYQVHTSIEIVAPPEVVWRRVIAFPPMTPPTGWPFGWGFAFPIEARLVGEGLTADRQCRFSTGSFKEPILVWEPGKHFAFAVSEEPLLMKETSPYGDIKVRHLEDHDFQPERVDFVITRLPNGNSRLEGTTTYQNKMWPGVYWRIWTDALIHSIHNRVFVHLKQLSEADERELALREQR